MNTEAILARYAEKFGSQSEEQQVEVIAALALLTSLEETLGTEALNFILDARRGFDV